MNLVLHELAGADRDVRFSPHCWKTRMALAHKGLVAERKPWQFVDKEAIAFSGQGKVPVLVHDDKHVSDSWAIATHLEDRFPDAPNLFGDHISRANARFTNEWADAVLLPSLAKLLMTDIYASLASCDRDYFRETREARFGQELEACRQIERSAFMASEDSSPRYGKPWATSHSYQARSRSMLTIVFLATSCGRVASVTSNCWSQTTRSTYGETHCWRLSTEWPSRRLVRA